MCIRDRAKRLRDQGYLVVILGEPEHPEVMGIRSYAGRDALVVEGPEDLPAEIVRSKVGVVVQTTQPPERLAALVAALAPRVRELQVFNTCLLYTSPSPRDRTRSRMPSSA